MKGNFTQNNGGQSKIEQKRRRTTKFKKKKKRNKSPDGVVKLNKLLLKNSVPKQTNFKTLGKI